MDNENTFTHWMIGRQSSSLEKWNYEIRRQMNVPRNSHPGWGNPERQTVHASCHMWLRPSAVCFPWGAATPPSTQESETRGHPARSSKFKACLCYSEFKVRMSHFSETLREGWGVAGWCSAGLAWLVRRAVCVAQWQSSYLESSIEGQDCGSVVKPCLEFPTEGVAQWWSPA